MRGKRHRRTPKGSSCDHDSVSKHIGRSSHQYHSQLLRDRPNESKDRRSVPPRRVRDERPNAVMDAMSQALKRTAQSHFFEEIEHTEMQRHFTYPSFTCYDSKTNLIEHISHFTQHMAFYSRNDGLLCKVFPSSLDPTTMRWFNGLKKGSVHNFRELIQAFGARFVTCSRVPQPIDALLSMKTGSQETL